MKKTEFCHEDIWEGRIFFLKENHVRNARKKHNLCSSVLKEMIALACITSDCPIQSGKLGKQKMQHHYLGREDKVNSTITLFSRILKKR